MEIGKILGISRKQVARVLAEAKPTEDEGPKPIRCPRRPKPDEIFPTETGDTA